MQRGARQRSTGAFLAVCAGCAALALLTEVPFVQGPRDAARGIVGPPEAAMAAIAGAGTQALSIFGDISRLNAANHALEADNAALRAQVARLQAAGQENDQLRKSLAFEHTFGHAMVTAGVIGWSPDPAARAVVIDRGAADGVRPGMVVAGAGGLVGLVTAVARHSASVRTLADSDSRVNVYGAASGLDGTLIGGPGAFAMQVHPQPGHFLARGEWVLTSGIGGTYPRGIPVGRVMTFQRSDAATMETATVAWAEAYTSLATVLVITDYRNPLAGP